MASIDLCVHGVLLGSVLTSDDGSRWKALGTACATPLSGFYQLHVVTPSVDGSLGEVDILRTVYDS